MFLRFCYHFCFFRDKWRSPEKQEAKSAQRETRASSVTEPHTKSRQGSFGPTSKGTSQMSLVDLVKQRKSAIDLSIIAPLLVAYLIRAPSKAGIRKELVRLRDGTRLCAASSNFGCHARNSHELQQDSLEIFFSSHFLTPLRPHNVELSGVRAHHRLVETCRWG